MLWLIVAGITAVVLAHTAPFPFLLESFSPARSLWHMPGDRDAPAIYLTFDDGPNPAATPALLADVVTKVAAAFPTTDIPDRLRRGIAAGALIIM